MNTTRLPVHLLLATVLAGASYGCAGAKPRTLVPKYISKYNLHENHAPLEVPGGMDHVEMVNLYPVPGGVPESVDGKVFYEVKMPNELINPATGNIRVQEMGNESWMLIDIAASHIWPRLRGFVTNNRLPVEGVDVAAGVITTNWLTPEDAPREKYRFWIESGLRNNTSEIHLLHVTEDYLKQNRNRWPEKSVDPERARVMLESVAGYFLDLNQAVATVSAAVSQFKQEARMSVEPTESGVSSLVLDVGFDRAWAALDLALNKAKILIVDLNRDAGIYYVAYKPEQTLSKRERKRLLKEQKRAEARAAKGEAADIDAPVPRPASAKAVERAKNLPRAQLHVSRNQQAVVVEVHTSDPLSELKVAELNELLRRIAAYLS